MHLTHLGLEEFRLYQHYSLDITQDGLRVIGRNASGKTSLLEAIVMLATTRSPRASLDRDTIGWESGKIYGVAPYTRLQASVETRHGPRTIVLSMEFDTASGPSAVTKKTFTVDGRNVRAHDLVGILNTVLFSPEDVQLVTGPPSERRRQLDVLISQIDRGYMRALSRYGRVISQRNGLLKDFARNRVTPRSTSAMAQLSFWDEELIQVGAYIVAARLRVTTLLSESIGQRSRSLIPDGDIAVTYEPRLPIAVSVSEEIDDERRRQVVAAAYQEELEATRNEEFRRGVTLTGPHRDDVLFTIDGRAMAAYGSRGQQRLGVVALKLAESDVIAKVTHERPLVLLDDVLSELDETHRDFLLAEVTGQRSQLFVTSADRQTLDHPALATLPFVETNGGVVAVNNHGSACGH